MKRIGVFTSSRSDYGILSKLIKELKKSKQFRLKLFVAGSHLSNFFGYTVKEIKKDFKPNIINCPNIAFTKNEIDVTKSLIKLSNIFFKNLQKKKNKIDLMILLGDRYELLPIANICLINGVEIAHIHGGEITEGAIDNNIRNSISMMSNYHFVSTFNSKNRLINFGINNKKIFQIGAPGLEGANEDLFTKIQLEKKFKFKFFDKNIIISYHPETRNIKNIQRNFNILINGIKKFKKIRFIFSAPGADIKSYSIKKNILKFVKNNSNCLYFDSVGHKEYLSFLKVSDLLIGNSSSGIIEAPSLKTISINLGIRQRGRERANSVINEDFNEKKIQKIIKKVINIKTKDSKIFKNPYFPGSKTSKKFIKILSKIIK